MFIVHHLIDRSQCIFIWCCMHSCWAGGGSIHTRCWSVHDGAVRVPGGRWSHTARPDVHHRPRHLQDPCLLWHPCGAECHSPRQNQQPKGHLLLQGKICQGRRASILWAHSLSYVHAFIHETQPQTLALVSFALLCIGDLKLAAQLQVRVLHWLSWSIEYTDTCTHCGASGV